MAEEEEGMNAVLVVIRSSEKEGQDWNIKKGNITFQSLIPKKIISFLNFKEKREYFIILIYY